MGVLNSFIERQFRDFIRSGGVPVSKEQAEARINVCRSCPYFGSVEPKQGIVFDEGCRKCGCPSVTKPHYKTYYRHKDRMHESLTLSELVQLKLGNRKDLKEITAECPHEEGNKWLEVDKKFEN